jgi:DNA ligase-1
MFDKILYKLHSSGQIGSWRIFVEAWPAEIVREACKVLGGKAVVTRTVINEGKNIGRSNETTAHEQAILEAESKYKKKMDEGYVITPPKAGDAVTNGLGFLKPMLAHPINKVKKWDFPVFVQPKFDGHRMLATVQDGQVVLYSRKGKTVSVEHIRDILQRAYENFLCGGGGWDGTTLDGEIYQHGETLQRIASLVKKPKVESRQLKYHVYDIMNPDRAYNDRLDDIKSATAELDPEFVEVTVTTEVHDQQQLNELHAHAIGQGYEGTIIRHGEQGYEDGKRSQSLLKKKDFQDAEFKIVGYELGKPDIKPDATYERPILICEAANGQTFGATAPGTMQERHSLYSNGLDKVINQMLTVKYFNLTPDGIPFHGVALRLREDI